MAAQKWKKKKEWQNFFTFLNAYYLKTHLIKALSSLYSSKASGRLSQNPKIEGFRKLFLSKNDFKTCSAVNFSKKRRFWRPRNQPKTRNLDF